MYGRRDPWRPRQPPSTDVDPSSPVGGATIALESLIEGTSSDIRHIKQLQRDLRFLDQAKQSRYADRIAKLCEQLKEIEDDLRAAGD